MYAQLCYTIIYVDGSFQMNAAGFKVLYVKMFCLRSMNLHNGTCRVLLQMELLCDLRRCISLNPEQSAYHMSNAKDPEVHIVFYLIYFLTEITSKLPD